MSENNNQLETLLAQAATEPAYRPAFFRTLLESSVWVPGSAAQDGAFSADSAVDLHHWEKADGTSVIPFFTSLQTLEQAVQDEQPFVVMPVRTLFEMTTGETLFLNARLETGKEFSPQEIRHLLSQEGDPLSQQQVLEGGEALLLSEVAQPPQPMLDSLSTLFKTMKTVKRAFICSLKEQAQDEPVWLIGLEVEGDNIDAIIREAGSVAMDTLPGDEPVDICLIQEGQGGISHFMIAHLTPFYERRWGSFLRDFKDRRIL